ALPHLHLSPTRRSSDLRSLIDQVPSLSAGHRRAWTDPLLELLGDHQGKLSAAAESAMVRLLVAMKDPRAESALWDRIGPPHPNRSEEHTSELQSLTNLV